MYIVLHKIKTLIEDYFNGKSKFNLLVQIETVADTFHRRTGEISTLLDVFPLQELHPNNQIKHEIVPDQAHLSLIFDKLEIRDASSCTAEIESLEKEIINGSGEQSKTDLVTLIGLIRFAKCVLFSASTPSPSASVLRRNQSSELAISVDYQKVVKLLRILRWG